MDAKQHRGRGRPALGQERELAPFGRKLREALRSSRFKSRAEFRREMGVENATLYRYEVGDRDPPASLVQKFALALGIGVEALLSGDEPRENVVETDTPGWKKFVRTGMREHYLARGLSEHQLDWVRSAPGRDPQTSLGWYVDLCELLLHGAEPHADF